MALKATIFKAELQVSNLDRHYYHNHQLTIARHPSETDERMMLRILLFALHADEQLQFGKGVSTEDEPDLWIKNLQGDIVSWIELGQPDEKRLRKACARAKQVAIYPYRKRSAEPWWQQLKTTAARFDNLTVTDLSDIDKTLLERMAQRSMQLQCTIEDGEVWFGDAEYSVNSALRRWQ